MMGTSYHRPDEPVNSKFATSEYKFIANNHVLANIRLTGKFAASLMDPSDEDFPDLEIDFSRCYWARNTIPPMVGNYAHGVRN